MAKKIVVPEGYKLIPGSEIVSVVSKKYNDCLMNLKEQAGDTGGWISCGKDSPFWVEHCLDKSKYRDQYNFCIKEKE